MRLKLVKTFIFIFIVTVLLLVFTLKVLIKNPTIRSGYPGNKHLTELKTDPIFKMLPSSIQSSGSITQKPAQYRLTDFKTVGPEVKETFVTDRSVSEIYQFYEELATNDGWQLRNSGSNGFAETWTKTYPDTVTGYLSLENSENNSNEHTYVLTGTITKISK